MSCVLVLSDLYGTVEEEMAGSLMTSKLTRSLFLPYHYTVCCVLGLTFLGDNSQGQRGCEDIPSAERNATPAGDEMG